MDRLKVKDNKDLERDLKSNAIVNTNKSAYEMARKRARDAQAERDKLRDVTREVNEIKCEMHDIKNMLTQTSLTVPINKGKIILGIWQGIYLFEHRYNSIKRKIMYSYIGS